MTRNNNVVTTSNTFAIALIRAAACKVTTQSGRAQVGAAAVLIDKHDTHAASIAIINALRSINKGSN